MRIIGNFLAIFFTALLLVSCQQKEPNQLCGTWRMVNGIYKGPDFTVETNEDKRICYKLISEKNFAVIEMFKSNPESLFFAAVGHYEWDDTSYVEHYEASNVPTKIGETERFTSRLDGDLWHISMKSQDMELEETWRRVVSEE